MFVSQGLVDPKGSHKLSCSKGKQVNIPVHSKYAVSWDVLVMDTDEHPVYNKEGERINEDRPIVVGNHVWSGCKCMLLKGAGLPDNTILAAGTALRSAFRGEDQIIGANPASILKRDVKWEA